MFDELFQAFFRIKGYLANIANPNGTSWPVGVSNQTVYMHFTPTDPY